MGKKRIIQKTEKELLKEREDIESGVKKASLKKVKIEKAKICIFSSYNNTIITLSNEKGDVLTWSTSGKVGFKGTKKATPYAASKVAENIAFFAQKQGIQKADIFVKGIGAGRESAIRSLAAKGIEIISIKDITPLPHNGCRPKKPRRA
ncbi:MAG: 30S ribosomal protein S11 [Candidatus Pacebacteria bacterium]|nr:30S ribosomal protein S11 [Candidatus Paceibacterota bacterium]